MKGTKALFHKEITKNIEMEYLIYLPKDYDGIKKFPLVVFLHGTGERGKDIELVKKHGVGKYAESKENIPFIAVTPQCPVGFKWVLLVDELYELLQEIKRNYAIDEERVCFTGLTIGAEASYALAIKYPEEISSIMPLTGGWKDFSCLSRIKDVAVWAFHGEKDTVAPIEETKSTIDFLVKNNCNAKFTLYPESGHDVWTETYANDEVYEWMLNPQK